MEDFKKDSLLENYNRIKRVNETITESINDGHYILTKLASEHGADHVLAYILDNMDVRDRAKIAYDLMKNPELLKK